MAETENGSSPSLELLPEAVESKSEVVDAPGRGLPPLRRMLHGSGRIATPVFWPRKAHDCRYCQQIIEVCEPHYTITWGGAGLGSLKFPDRVHVACLWKYFYIEALPDELKNMWGKLFDYAYDNCRQLAESGKMKPVVICMQRVWKEYDKLRRKTDGNGKVRIPCRGDGAGDIRQLGDSDKGPGVRGVR